MRLASVLEDGTDGLGHPVLATYYRAVFGAFLPDASYRGCFRVRVALNFGVQQLATRSRIAPDDAGYLQIGGFDAFDLPAALIEAMPHTRVVCLHPPVGTAEALARLRAALPGDAMPTDIRLDQATLTVRFGFIAVFDDAQADFSHLLGAGGTVLHIARTDTGVAFHDAS